jgi:hypothetical protein
MDVSNTGQQVKLVTSLDIYLDNHASTGSTVRCQSSTYHN